MVSQAGKIWTSGREGRDWQREVEVEVDDDIGRTSTLPSDGCWFVRSVSSWMVEG